MWLNIFLFNFVSFTCTQIIFIRNYIHERLFSSSYDSSIYLCGASESITVKRHEIHVPIYYYVDEIFWGEPTDK